MKKITVLLFLILAGTAALAQAPVIELDDPHPSSPSIWDNVNVPVFGWGDVDVKYKKDQVPQLAKTLSVYGWRGERVHAQAVLLAPQGAKEFRVSVSELKFRKNIIPSSAIDSYYETYVMGEVKFQGDTVLCPDRLVKLDAMAVPQKTLRPVWLTVNIPRNAVAGKYKGTVTATVDGKAMSIPYTVEVGKRVLPEPKDWKFHLDLWQNPYAVARYFNVPLWSKEHFAVMRPMMEYLASMGQKVITTSIFQHPWNSQTEDPFESMIGKFKGVDGSWSYDYTVFDRWVEFMMSCGITEQIDCYTVLPWHLSFEYYDAAINCSRLERMEPGSREYEDYLFMFLTDFASHLKTKGWFSKTCIAMDERPKDQLENAYRIILKADPGYRIEGAVNYFGPEVAERMYDISFLYEQPPLTPEQLSSHHSKGNIVTFYTCCVPARPNTFINSNPSESVLLGWHAAALGYDGYLRWAYNSWVKDPNTDARYRKWRAGDCFLVYPDGPSIRTERMIEGIQDYEKIRIVREGLKARKAARLDAQLEKYTQIDWGSVSDADVTSLVNESRALLRSLE